MDELGVTLVQILDELEKAVGHEYIQDMQETDIDAEKVCKRFNVCYSTARSIMKRVCSEHPDKWTIVKVRKPNMRITSVLRYKSNGNANCAQDEILTELGKL